MSGCDWIGVVAFGSLFVGVGLIVVGDGFMFGLRPSTRDRMIGAGLLLILVFIVSGLIFIDPEACAAMGQLSEAAA